MTLEAQVLDLKDNQDRMALIVGQLGDDVRALFADLKLMQNTEEINGLVRTVQQLTQQVIALQTAMGQVPQQLDDLKQDYQGNNSRLNGFLTTLTARVSALERTDTATTASINSLTNRVVSLENQFAPLKNSVSQLPKISAICQKLVSTLNPSDVSYVKVGSADTNGYMTYDINQLPANAVSKSNDAIISIVPYDTRGNNTKDIIVSWADADADNKINVHAQWADDNTPVSGCRFIIWYAAKSATYGMAL